MRTDSGGSSLKALSQRVIHTAAGRPVRLLDLERAYFENGAYAANILSAFDGNRDGSLSADELVIDTLGRVAVERLHQVQIAAADRAGVEVA